MALATELNTAQGGRLSRRLGGLFADLETRWSRRRLYSRTRTELSALSDRELADLGLSRSMIKRLAWQAAYEN